jgi:hypothetical protein
MPINIPNTFSVVGNAVVSGGGGGGGTVSYQMDEFKTSGTWTKPAGFIGAEVVVIGAGGGGASGSRQASGVATRGGSAGGGGSILLYYFDDSALAATESITIGAGGTAGPAVLVDNTNGSSGGIGGTTSIGTVAVVLGASNGTFDQGGGVYHWNSLTPNDSSISISGATGQPSSSSGGAGDSSEVQSSFSLYSMPRRHRNFSYYKFRDSFKFGYNWNCPRWRRRKRFFRPNGYSFAPALFDRRARN